VILIVVVGVIIALAALVGTVLEWASTPDLAAVQDAVYKGMIKMPWYEQNLELSPEFGKMFAQWYELSWTMARSFGGASLSSGLANIILTPLWLIVGWLVYGLLAHLFARLLNGQANLAQTLGCTALAVAPQVLRLTELLPYVTVGGVVGTWMLICRYLALKQAHRLTWGRAFWATVLPLLIFLLLGLILAAIGTAVFGALASLVLGGA
jgi:hypothetical protein